MSVEKLIVDHMETWTSALQTRSTAGRGSSGKIDLYGIKKLRELILELAVRGKLVPQDPKDEPASELLKRIAAEKAELVKQGKIKKQKPLPEISEEEKPFELPEGWEWVRVADLMEVINGRAYKKHEMLQTGTPLLRVGNLFTSNEWYYSDLQLDENKYINNGDLIYAWSASFGPFIWTGEKVIYHYHIWKLNLFAEEYSNKYFIYDFLLSITDKIKSQGNGIAMLHMTKEKMEQQIIALPPINEQQQIVRKIRELTVLCDQLEQQSLTSLDAHQQLVETLLGTLTDSQNAEELAENWARISEHFDTLFTTEASVDALKQTILQLAVMGKLVPQDPNDEPAENLFNRLCITRNLSLQNQLENKEADIMLRKIKKTKPATPPFKLPENWICTNLIEICEYLVDCHNKTAPYVDAGIPIIRTTNIRNRNFQEQDLKFVKKETYEFWSRRCTPQPGDIIFTREAPMGEALIIPPNVQWCLGQRTMLIRVMHEFISNEFILLALTEPLLLERASKHAVGLTVKHLRVGDVETLNIPLPPLNEQYRIVAKVKILLSLCDKAQKKIKSAQQTQLHLADALTDAAIN